MQNSKTMPMNNSLEIMPIENLVLKSFSKYPPRLKLKNFID
jgi:hypothetical protein